MPLPPSASLRLHPAARIGPSSVWGLCPVTPLSTGLSSECGPVRGRTWTHKLSLRAASSADPPGKGHRKQHWNPASHRPSPRRCSADSGAPSCCHTAKATSGAAGPGKHAQPRHSSSISHQTSLAQACRLHTTATVPTSSDPSAAGLCPCLAWSKTASPLSTRGVLPQGSAAPLVVSSANPRGNKTSEVRAGSELKKRSDLPGDKQVMGLFSSEGTLRVPSPTSSQGRRWLSSGWALLGPVWTPGPPSRFLSCPRSCLLTGHGTHPRGRNWSGCQGEDQVLRLGLAWAVPTVADGCASRVQTMNRGLGGQDESAGRGAESPAGRSPVPLLLAAQSSPCPSKERVAPRWLHGRPSCPPPRSHLTLGASGSPS